MNELYEAIEKKIKASGYPRAISGADVYDDIQRRHLRQILIIIYILRFLYLQSGQKYHHTHRLLK